MAWIDDELAAIKARLRGVLEGPWIVEEHRIGITVGKPKSWCPREVYAYVYTEGSADDPFSERANISKEQARVNAKFIAAARTDVPRLTAALDAVLAHHRQIVDDGMQGFDPDDSSRHYGMMSSVCSSCGEAGEYSVRWPCPTVRAVADALRSGPVHSLTHARVTQT